MSLSTSTYVRFSIKSSRPFATKSSHIKNIWLGTAERTRETTTTTNNILLPEMDHNKHLGLWLESSLSWDYHINSICAKANKVLGLIKRTFGYSNKTDIKTAFKVLVIPILEYACPVWNPYLVKHTKAIEAIQRRASRLICGPRQRIS